jgi:hypothetical protein
MNLEQTDKNRIHMFRLGSTLILLFGLIVAGCRAQADNGRLDQLIITEAASYGGIVVHSPMDQPLLGKWVVKRDKYGTVITCTGVSFQALDHFLRVLYGTPREGGKNGEGNDQWVIPAKVAGVSFWYSKMGDGVQITILKPDNLWH